jgi:hypothetical protein
MEHVLRQCVISAPAARRPSGRAEPQGRIPLWEWIGDEAATTFSY